MSHIQNSTAALPALTIGLDVGDKASRLCGIDAAGSRTEERIIATTQQSVEKYFANCPKARVVLEVGTHSPWLSRLIESLGHDVIVANPSAMYGSKRRKKRNDRMDAEYLARQGRADVALLHPIQHRRVKAQQHLEMLRARDQIVRSRSKLINHVRSAVKSMGGRLPKCSAEAFVHRVADDIPVELRDALAPMLVLIVSLNNTISHYDRSITSIITEHYPEAIHLQQPKGVGPITALAFVLLIDDKHRFKKSRDVGAFFGLVPRLDESSEQQPQLRITKAGDALGRRLLVGAGQYILGPFGPPCDLRRHGEALMMRGGKNAKKRAVVAVARKLAVLLHHLLITGVAYQPDHLQQRRAA